MTRITVAGAGNGGCAAAADLTLRGHQVTLCSRSPATLEPIVQRGGIETDGLLGTNFARVAKVTPDIREAIEDAEIIMVVVPGPGHEYYAKRLAPIIEEKQSRWGFQRGEAAAHPFGRTRGFKPRVRCNLIIHDV